MSIVADKSLDGIGVVGGVAGVSGITASVQVLCSLYPGNRRFWCLL